MIHPVAVRMGIVESKKFPDRHRVVTTKVNLCNGTETLVGSLPCSSRD